ncbi:ly6/PLAUR domain-containing protein 6-like [Babylonia areolata]|uniref:ly6/PLAUR domain-containing protein 6-like n=1 Tax=Babylonia areolata TaxID=304850 RepID=UPI003FCFC3D1
MDRTGGVSAGGCGGVGMGVAARRRGWTEQCGVVVVCLLVVTVHVGVSANTVLWSPTRSPTSDITCWTCNNKANNEDCNNWAPDLKCPINHTVCQTVHRLSVPRGVSVEVSKRCVHTSVCTPHHVGCSLDDLTGQQVCVSCCDYSYCNQGVPVNGSTALQLSFFSPAAPSRAATTPAPSPFVLPGLLWLGTLWALRSLCDVTWGS